ncbi:TRAP transporter small permease [Mariniradius sediminis]|uniref:TRAP transporter small permease n=1 Tax=Mariniradius sediminis TaxID=2909237 RepID=A0ABS9BUN0_9BACT|nr:TRAP transporter small permease [Mariniradius sediminis]MCF1751054.1 TRAP transporter small permease [Mariniradius sediminis]
MQNLKNVLDKLVSWLLIVLMGAMVVNVSWQVISRYIFQNPSSFTDELARYMLVWLGTLGAACVAGKNEHIAIDVLPNKLEGQARAKLMIFVHALILLFALIAMVMGGSNLVYITYILEQKSATLQIPLAYIYGIIPVSGLIVMFYQIPLILDQRKNFTN